MELYYSDGYRDELIELSDEHIGWYIKFTSENDEAAYQRAIEDAIFDFKFIYDVDLILTGRSGRHVCVENTAKNRRSIANMQRTVRRMQNEILMMFDAGWRINQHGTLYHVNGSIRIGSVKGRDIITHANSVKL